MKRESFVGLMRPVLHKIVGQGAAFSESRAHNEAEGVFDRLAGELYGFDPLGWAGCGDGYLETAHKRKQKSNLKHYEKILSQLGEAFDKVSSTNDALPEGIRDDHKGEQQIVQRYKDEFDRCEREKIK